jgi:hypothetical protein
LSFSIKPAADAHGFRKDILQWVIKEPYEKDAAEKDVTFCDWKIILFCGKISCFYLYKTINDIRRKDERKRK